MPTYIRKCPNCDKKVEVVHGMGFIGNEKELPEDTLKFITCDISHCDKNSGCLFKVCPPSNFHILGSRGGSVLTGRDKINAVKKERKRRSSDHFQREILPNLDKDVQAHHAKKGKKPK